MPVTDSVTHTQPGDLARRSPPFTSLSIQMKKRYNTNSHVLLLTLLWCLYREQYFVCVRKVSRLPRPRTAAAACRAGPPWMWLFLIHSSLALGFGILILFYNKEIERETAKKP